MFAAGDTFLIPDTGVGYHLSAIISDPAQDIETILFVVVTSRENDKEDVCVLDAADREGIPFLSHDSVVAYRFSFAISEVKLASLIAAGQFRPHAPFRPETVRKIRKGADESRLMPNKFWTLLDRQGLI